MESKLGNVFLHPAILVASGVNALSSGDVRFLNNFRRHFDRSKFNYDQIISISDVDFHVGGIMNPANEFCIPMQAFASMCRSGKCQPYMSRRQIFKQVYVDHLEDIYGKIVREILKDLSGIEESSGMHRYKLRAERIKDLYRTPIYAKIVALHLCGIGDKLGEAFDYFFGLYDEQITQTS